MESVIVSMRNRPNQQTDPKSLNIKGQLDTNRGTTKLRKLKHLYAFFFLKSKDNGQASALVQGLSVEAFLCRLSTYRWHAFGSVTTNDQEVKLKDSVFCSRTLAPVQVFHCVFIILGLMTSFTVTADLFQRLRLGQFLFAEEDGDNR